MYRKRHRGHSYFGVNVIQDARVGDYSRHETDSINVFSDKNVRFEPTATRAAFQGLRKAVPIYLDSLLKLKAATPCNLFRRGHLTT